jgi:hypothetical protein
MITESYSMWLPIAALAEFVQRNAPWELSLTNIKAKNLIILIVYNVAAAEKLAQGSPLDIKNRSWSRIQVSTPKPILFTLLLTLYAILLDAL